MTSEVESQWGKITGVEPTDTQAKKQTDYGNSKNFVESFINAFFNDTNGLLSVTYDPTVSAYRYRVFTVSLLIL